VRISIEASDLPGLSCGPSPDSPGGYQNIHVGVQRRGRRDELLGLVPGDAPAVTWTMECTAAASPAGTDLKGPYIQGPPGGRFIYLSWGTVHGTAGFTLFRRAKLWLGGVPDGVLDQALELGLLVGRLGLTDPKGQPAVRGGTAAGHRMVCHGRQRLTRFPGTPLSCGHDLAPGPAGTRGHQCPALADLLRP
jgi:hypothetical protein